MITPEKNDADSGAICAPTAALEIDGTAPAVGDEVEITAKARVTRIEGGETYLAPIEINGQPVPPKAGSPAGDVDEAGAVMRAAMDADARR